MNTKCRGRHPLRWRSGATGALTLLWIGASIAAAAPTIRTLEVFSELPARHISPQISYQDGKLMSVVFAGPRSYPVHLISLDEIGFQERDLLSPTISMASAFDSFGQLHMVRPKSGLEYTIDSAAFSVPQTITIPNSQVAYPTGPVALALDSRDRPFIAFLGSWEGTSGRVLIARFNIASGAWEIQSVSGSPQCLGGMASLLALTFDQQDRPVIAYIDVKFNVVVLSQNEQGWVVQQTSGIRYATTGLALACNKQGTPLVLASVYTGPLVLLRVGPTGFVSENLSTAASTYVLGPRSMVVDKNDGIHAAYYDRTSTAVLRVTEKTGPAWTFTDIATVALRDNYGGPGICLDSNNQWVVSFYSQTALTAYVAGPNLPQRIEGQYDVPPGRWSECEIGGGPGQPGNKLHSASWDGSTPAASWELTGLTIQSVQEIANTVDGGGNGQITYETIYDTSTADLLVDAALYGETGTQQITLDTYKHVTVFTMTAGQIVWDQSYTDMTATGFFTDYLRNSVEVTGRASFDGNGTDLPTGYPAWACTEAVNTGRWGSVSNLSLQIRYCQEDDDFDHAPNCTDNCPTVTNPSQSDWDHDGIGDACESSAHIFVNQAAPAGGDGVSWATAYNTLREALSAAISMSSASPTIKIEIWVAAGIYKPDQGPDATPGDIAAVFVVPSRTTLRGGFVGNEDPATFDLDTRDLQANATVLSGDLLGDDETGGGNTDNSLKIIHCGNATSVLIDGLQISYATGTAEDQGALFLGIADSIVRNCVLRKNYGPAIRTMAGNTRLETCLIAGNGPSYGCGIVAGGNVDVIGCTIVENSDLAGLAFSGGISVSGSCQVNVVSSILWGNVGVTGTNLAIATGASLAIRESLAQFGMYGVYNDGTATLTWSWENLDSDPLFVANGAWSVGAWTPGDYHLAGGSPAINAGNNDALTGISRDLDGNLRVIGCVADIGVYENTAAGPGRPNGFALDGDCDVDMADFAILETCATGPGMPIGAIPGCESADTDFDGDIDSVDFAGFQRCFSGDGVPAGTTCDD